MTGQTLQACIGWRDQKHQLLSYCNHPVPMSCPSRWSVRACDQLSIWDSGQGVRILILIEVYNPLLTEQQRDALSIDMLLLLLRGIESWSCHRAGASGGGAK